MKISGNGRGKRKQRNRKSWKYQDRIRKAVSGDWLKAVFPAGIPGYSHRRNLVLYGAEILAQFWIYEVSVGGILAVILILSHFILEKVGKNGKLKAEEVETEDPWRVFTKTRKSRRRPMIFCDNKDPEERICPAQVSGLKAQVRAENIKETEEFQTMLLTPKEKPDHILVSAKPENGDIPVGYVPFVIGKHTGLAIIYWISLQ